MAPRRRAGKRHARRRFLVVVEGSSTEFRYFRECRQLFAGRAQLAVAHDASSPDKVVAEAIRLKDQDALRAGSKGDHEARLERNPSTEMHRLLQDLARIAEVALAGST